MTLRETAPCLEVRRATFRLPAASRAEFLDGTPPFLEKGRYLEPVVLLSFVTVRLRPSGSCVKPDLSSREDFWL
jgi:hypothetical protein